MEYEISKDLKHYLNKKQEFLSSEVKKNKLWFLKCFTGFVKDCCMDQFGKPLPVLCMIHEDKMNSLFLWELLHERAILCLRTKVCNGVTSSTFFPRNDTFKQNIDTLINYPMSKGILTRISIYPRQHNFGQD